MRRLFIGVGFSSELRGYFQDAALMVEKYCETAKYTRRENFHLTLKFLGMMDESTINTLIDVINHVEVNELTLYFDHIGFFKKKNRYVIYMGLHPNEALTQIAIDLHDALVEKGLTSAEEFIYTPHITLCRKAKFLVPSVDLSRGIEISKETMVNNITLYESTNIDGVLTYRPIYIREV